MPRNIIPVALSIFEDTLEAGFRALQQARDTARQDDGRGNRHTRRRMIAWRYYLRRLISEQPFIKKRVVGIITQINEERKECTAVVEGELRPVEHINYYPPSKAPKQGERYLVTFEHKLPTKTLEEESSLQEGERWIKIIRERWLYRKLPNETKLIRYAWPPPSEATGWTVEVVKASGLPVNSRLFGSSTNIDDGEHTQIVLTDGTGALSGVEGQLTPQGQTSHYYHYDAMGFGDLEHEYDLNPLYPSTLRSIANDGTNTVAIDSLFERISLDGGFGHAPTLEEEGRIQCCQVSPIDSNTYCITAVNYRYIFPVAPNPPYSQNTATKHRVYFGDLGELAIHTVLDLPRELYSTNTPSSQVLHTNHYEGTSCDWYADDPLIGLLVWLDLVVTINDYPLPDGQSAEVILGTGEQKQFSGIAKSWNPEGIPTNAYAYLSQTFIKNPADVANHETHPRLDRVSAKWVVVCEGIINKQFELQNNNLNIEPAWFSLALGLTGEYELTTWWHEFNPSNGNIRLFRTIGTNPTPIYPDPVDGVNIGSLIVVSRDGVDAVAMGEGILVRYYTVDSGETWTQMPLIIHDDTPTRTLPVGVQFVDELA